MSLGAPARPRGLRTHEASCSSRVSHAQANRAGDPIVVGRMRPDLTTGLWISRGDVDGSQSSTKAGLTSNRPAPRRQARGLPFPVQILKTESTNPKVHNRGDISGRGERRVGTIFRVTARGPSHKSISGSTVPGWLRGDLGSGAGAGRSRLAVGGHHCDRDEEQRCEFRCGQQRAGPK